MHRLEADLKSSRSMASFMIINHLPQYQLKSNHTLSASKPSFIAIRLLNPDIILPCFLAFQRIFAMEIGRMVCAAVCVDFCVLAGGINCFSS
jgi:hypothetical protein